MTEFTSSHGVVQSIAQPKGARSPCVISRSSREEHPISAQLFGVRPGRDGRRGAHLRGHGFDIVDINFGCPVKKVVKCNGGSGLLRDLPLVEHILRSAQGHHHSADDASSAPGGTIRSWSHVKMAQTRRGQRAVRRSRCIRGRASRATAARPTGHASRR